jgi:chemosensory pili system protein ChpA (sensor histidine kinase/response regulator)
MLIQTEPGNGTRFIIRLPFSLAVTQALLVQAGEAVFAIPLLSIEVVTRLKESEFHAYLAGEQVQHQYSDRHYPVHNLGILVGSEHVLPFEEVKDRRPPTLLFRSAEASAALQVEAVMGNKEIIVKPISPQFKGVPGISGATVLGDGRVVVVLELAALVRNIGSQRQKQAESRACGRRARRPTRKDQYHGHRRLDHHAQGHRTHSGASQHPAITAKDGLDAVAMLQTQVPDLAILDIEMPRMDGFEVIAHVRNQAHLRHLPIIMVTSRGGEKHRERAMNLGVNDYLTKPYQEDQLMQSIRKILGERGAGSPDDLTRTHIRHVSWINGNAPSNLRCLLITVQGGQVILPNSLVVEVLPFATPLRIEAAPHWVVGAMLWHNLTTPLISLGR